MEEERCSGQILGSLINRFSMQSPASRGGERANGERMLDRGQGMELAGGGRQALELKHVEVGYSVPKLYR